MANDSKIVISEQSIYSLCYWISNQFKANDVEIDRLGRETELLSMISLANQCWLLAAFSHGIKDKNCWDGLPIEYQEYLSEICDVYKNRTSDLIEELEQVVPCLNGIGITPILLKGAATLINGVSQPRHIRYMNDIDILVKPETLENATQQMVNSGYILDDENYDIDEYNHHHQSPLKRIGSQCYVELHRWHFKSSLLSILSSDDVWKSAKPCNIEDKYAAKICAPTHQIIVNIVHSELSDRGYFEKNIQLFQLFALYQLVSFYQDDIDWQDIISRFENIGVEKVLFARMHALVELFGCDLSQYRSKFANVESNKHLTQCLSNYVKNQDGNRLFAVITGQLSEYSRLSIKAHYGVEAFWEVFLVRCNILKNQLKKLTNKHYLKKFIWANFN